MTHTADDYTSTTQLAALLGLTPQAISARVRTGTLTPTLVLGGAFYFDADLVADLVATIGPRQGHKESPACRAGLHEACTHHWCECTCHDVPLIEL